MEFPEPKPFIVALHHRCFVKFPKTSRKKHAIEFYFIDVSEF